MEALNAVHFLAEKNSIALPNNKGDILYVNNMALLHGREAMKKEESVARESALSRRHKLKFFLRDPKRAWKIPESMRHRWDKIYGPNQDDGGKKEQWLLAPDSGVRSVKWSTNG